MNASITQPGTAEYPIVVTSPGLANAWLALLEAKVTVTIASASMMAERTRVQALAWADHRHFENGSALPAYLSKSRGKRPDRRGTAKRLSG